MCISLASCESNVNTIRLLSLACLAAGIAANSGAQTIPTNSLVRFRLSYGSTFYGDIDVERTMDRVPTLVNAGVTDFRTIIRLPADRAAAAERLAGIVAAFRTAVGIPQ